MIQLRIEGADWDDVRRQILVLIEGTEERPVKTLMASMPETRKPGRPKKAAPPEPKTVLEQAPLAPTAMDDTPPVLPPAPVEPPAPVDSTLTLEVVKTALKGVTTSRPGDASQLDGMKRAADILRSVGCVTVRELKPAHFATVLAACAASAKAVA